MLRNGIHSILHNLNHWIRHHMEIPAYLMQVGISEMTTMIGDGIKNVLDIGHYNLMLIMHLTHFSHDT